MISQRSLDALRAAMKVMGSAPERAAQVFVLATQDDPALADGWLGRYATGERTVAVLSKLSENAERLGEGLGRLQLGPANLGASFDIEYARFPIADQITAHLAYASALIASDQFQQASDILARLPADHPETGYVRACLATKTQRWPDVLTAVGVCTQNPRDVYLARAASLLEAWAAASLGLMQPALQAAQRVIDGKPTPTDGLAARGARVNDVLTRDALFCRALVLRHQGEDEESESVLTGIRVQWPDFERAHIALNDRTFGLEVTDPETIASRTDKWDPDTGTSRAARDQADRDATRQEVLARAEERLAAFIGLEGPKEQIAVWRTEIEIDLLLAEQGEEVGTANENHMVFEGPPGTAKTSYARIVAEILFGLGKVDRPTPLEVTEEDVVVGYVSQTAEKMREICEKALGGVLFIDEAYRLAPETDGHSFGKDAINTLLKYMEDYRDRLVVIVAGYPTEMRRFMATNPGLASRFHFTLTFDSYNAEEIVAIGQVIAKQEKITVAESAWELLRGETDRLRAIATKEGTALDAAGNGRYARKVVLACKRERARRLHTLGSAGLRQLATDDRSAFDVTDDDMARALASALTPEGVST
ncbi:AAA family ATPase (plasmid) [Mycobacterium sp. smrl_JER01]|uniref:AAA family ATPase n=1 Tax=Mycobacterium sp. smrl_JER01 TaxID=3402633 RepID=UPI003AC7AC97